MDANDIWYLPWINKFFDFYCKPFWLPKVGARTLAITPTTVKKRKVNNPKETYSIVEKNTANKANKQYFILAVGQIKHKEIPYTDTFQLNYLLKYQHKKTSKILHW